MIDGDDVKYLGESIIFITKWVKRKGIIKTKAYIYSTSNIKKIAYVEKLGLFFDNDFHFNLATAEIIAERKLYKNYFKTNWRKSKKENE